MDISRPTRSNYKVTMNKINRFVSIEIILALLIIIAYFLPWIDLGIVKQTGWEIPRLQKTVTQVGNFFSRNKSSVYTTYAIFAIPALSAMVIALWIIVKPRIARAILFLTGIFGTILPIYLYFNLPKHGSTGVYLLFAASLLSVVYLYFTFRRKRKVQDRIQNQSRNAVE